MELIKTGDGSHSIFVPELNEHYHSTHGAINEAVHVFIQNGLLFKSDLPEINILEIGFGTGLNALLTYLKAEELQQKVDYTTLENNPVSTSLIGQLNYTTQLQLNSLQKNIYAQMHDCVWEKSIDLSPFYSFKKLPISLVNSTFNNYFDVIYFDAFAPEKQPEMWTDSVFQKMYNALLPQGTLVTYCAKGVVKRTLKSIGFHVESLPGPPGKREMIRAIKC